MIQHLAKQSTNGTQSFKVRECGRKQGVEGSIRVLSYKEFTELMTTDLKSCCQQCLNRARQLQARNYVASNTYRDR